MPAQSPSAPWLRGCCCSSCSTVGCGGFPGAQCACRALTCPIGWRGSVPHTSSARGGRGPTGSAQPTPPLPWPNAHPTPTRERKRARRSFGFPEQGRAPLCYVGFLSTPECPKNRTHASGKRMPRGRKHSSMSRSHGPPQLLPQLWTHSRAEQGCPAVLQALCV